MSAIGSTRQPGASAPLEPWRPGAWARQQVLAAARECLHATITGRPILWSEGTQEELKHAAVAGVFTSLKRGKHLRACCGSLGRTVPLLAALRESVERTAWEDVRFPPVSPTEIEHLDMEIWLLHNPRPVEGEGEDRVKAVTVGKHGLQVARGQAHGLLLPGVAVEHGWEAEKFLEQTCTKAGLHPSMWKDPETAVTIFEGEAVRGRAAAEGTEALRAAPLVAREKLGEYVGFVRNNVHALLHGLTPSPYLFGAADGQVTGVCLTLRLPGKTEPVFLVQYALRPGVPLQSTLYALAQAAARHLARERITSQTLEEVQFGLTVFHDPTLHGTVTDPRLEGFQPEERALLVVEKNRTALVYEPTQPAADLVASAAQKAQIRKAESAALFSLAVVTAEPRLEVVQAPTPVRGPAARPPAVAGTFYPRDPAELDFLVASLLGKERREESWSAAMVPHAGLIYSGKIAAAVLRRLRYPRTILILGPKHTPLGMDWAVAPHQTWDLPGGQMASDPILARRLAEGIPGLALDALAHQREHGIEVELPFLARLAPESKVVGIAIGGGDLDACHGFAQGLAQVIRDLPEPPLLLISSDMNHFATDAETRRLDEMALSALDRLDAEELLDTVAAHHISMCGVLPAVIVLETLKLLGGLNQSERVGYATTADETGDLTRVVGYAGMLFR